MLAFAWWVTYNKTAKIPKFKVEKLSFAGCKHEPNMLKILPIIFLPALPKKVPIILSLFSYHYCYSHIILCINVSGMY